MVYHCLQSKLKEFNATGAAGTIRLLLKTVQAPIVIK